MKNNGVSADQDPVFVPEIPATAMSCQPVGDAAAVEPILQVAHAVVVECSFLGHLLPRRLFDFDSMACCPDERRMRPGSGPFAFIL